MVYKKREMESREKMNEKTLRRKFAERLRSLIAEEPGVQKLSSFSARSGLSISNLSEWQNLTRDEWPSMRNFLKLCAAAGKSADWFLFGAAPATSLLIDRLNALRPALSEKQIDQVLRSLEENALRYEKEFRRATGKTGKQDRAAAAGGAK